VPVAAAVPLLISGSADLHGSTLNYIAADKDFDKTNRAGRNLRYGIREHGMAAINNGVAYDGIFRTSCATFLVFADYSRPSMRLAALSKLPVVYIIENNRYGMGTSVERASGQPNLSRRGEGFDIPGEQVDGMDVRMTHDAAKRAIAHAREGNGPYILEMLTYRYRGHSMSDPAKYRSKDEVTTMRAEHDPIEQVKARIIEKRYGSEDSLKQIENEGLSA